VPQLVKGGKYVFGWSRIMNNGMIVVPSEAVNEYKLKPGKDVILVSGSKTSGGFVITAKSLLKHSVLNNAFERNPVFKNSRNNGNIIEYKKRKYGWNKIRILNTVMLNKQMLEAFGLKPGDELLSVRGSSVGISMIVKGPLVEHAKKHPEVNHFS
jgi:bifunctional DNA-binding transcriptional regulator/antitoxin component of YhaV-PrlF toxin-antitoxin module